ncbi:MAG: ABC transporter permease [Moraxellaceae bacterium]|nr:ABC transporter permease [Moraxellaceae bacterium]
MQASNLRVVDEDREATGLFVAAPAGREHPQPTGLARTEDVLRAAPRPPSAALPPPPSPPYFRLLAWARQHLPGYVLAACSLIGLVLAWHLATKYKLDFYIRFTNIPTPGEVMDKVAQVSQSKRFGTHVVLSLRRIFLGFALAGVLGIGLGLLIGRYKLMRSLFFPALEALRPIPAIAWVPISIMLWPDNEVSIVFITFIGAFFPILLNTVSGVQAVDGVLLRAGRCLGAKESALMWHVILPGAAPQIFTGLAVGMGVAWVSLIAAEMISGQFGIGYYTWEAYSLITYSEIVLGMITIGLLGLLCSGLIRLVGKAAMPWLAFSTQGGER